MADEANRLESRQAASSVERLHIAHLFLWTTMSALILAYDRATSEPSNHELRRSLSRPPAVLVWRASSRFACWDTPPRSGSTRSPFEIRATTGSACSGW